VSITAPTSDPTYTTNISALTLGGTAADDVSVTKVAWVNSAGSSGTATGTTSSAPSSDDRHAFLSDHGKAKKARKYRAYG
jgi:hypothetical protein